MSDAAMDATFSLRVMVNKDKTKVLFAEADSDFASILLGFLALPLGRIAKVLEKHYGDKAPAFGSISSLYKGLANLDDVHFSSKVAKLMLLDPPSSSDESIFSILKIHVFKHSPLKYFVCSTKWSVPCNPKCICMYFGDAARCSCGLPLKEEAEFESKSKSAEEPFIIETATFLISDDLKLVPNSASLFQTLNSFGVTVADGAELRNLTLGTNEIMDLLKCCLLSKTPLTDFVLNKGQINISLATQPNPRIFLHQIGKVETDAKNIVLRVMDGGVESLLDNKTCLNNLDNLYKSISDVSLDNYFISLDTKKRLMNPIIPYSSKSETTFLPFNYESAPNLYYSWRGSNILISRNNVYVSLFTVKPTIGEGNYVKKQTTYMVTDDLTVTPFHISSVFSTLNRLNISLSDVEEFDVHIGLQEVLSILKASLTSKSALNNGLFNRLMKIKQPKQEP